MPALRFGLRVTASGWRCVGATYSNGLVKLTPGIAAVCVITNNDKPRGHLTLVKKVINDSGGSARPTAWTLSARGLSYFSGRSGSAAVTKAAVVPGWYALSEAGPGGYVASGWRCPWTIVINGKVWVGRGAWITCTITNNDRRRW